MNRKISAKPVITRKFIILTSLTCKEISVCDCGEVECEFSDSNTKSYVAKGLSAELSRSSCHCASRDAQFERFLPDSGDCVISNTNSGLDRGTSCSAHRPAHPWVTRRHGNALCSTLQEDACSVFSSWG